MGSTALLPFLAAAAAVALAMAVAWRTLSRRVRAVGGARRRPVVGFLHPACLGGGGGERVLWYVMRLVAVHSCCLVAAAWLLLALRSFVSDGCAGGAPASAAWLVVDDPLAGSRAPYVTLPSLLCVPSPPHH